ncbi:MAG: hypothetical protein ACE5JU_09945 [Candidatus Binatia bacterium]
MADNIVLNVGSGGSTLATDEAGAPLRHFQYIKLADGTADSVAVIGGDATNGLDVDVTRLPLDRTATGTTTAAGQSVAINVEQGEGAVGIQITGVFVQTLQFEGTINGVDWFALRVHDGTTLVTSATAPGEFLAPSGHLDQIRVRASAFTSGTATINLKASRGATPVGVVLALPPGTNNIGDVDIASALPVGANRIGKVTVRNAADTADIDPLAEGTFTTRINTQGQKAMAGSTPVVIASDQSPLDVSDRALRDLGKVDIAAFDVQPAASHTRNELFAEANAIGGEMDDTAPVAATEGNVSPVRITAQRGLHVNLRDNAGSEVSPATSGQLPGALVGGRLDVNVGASVAIDITDKALRDLGKVDIAAFDVALPAGANNIGDVDIASFVAGAIVEVQGDVAHDAIVAGNPVLIGARANLNEPATAVAAGDATHLWADLLGRLVTVDGHSNPEAPDTTNATAAGDTALLAAPGAGVSHYIQKGSVHNGGASPVIVQLKDGATVRWQAELAADGGGSLFDFGARGWKLAANTALNGNLSAAGSVDFNITQRYVAA